MALPFSPTQWQYVLFDAFAELLLEVTLCPNAGNATKPQGEQNCMLVPWSAAIQTMALATHRSCCTVC